MKIILTEHSDGIEICDFFGFADLEAAKDLRPMQPGIQDMREPGLDQRIATGPNAIIVCAETDSRIYARYELWDGPATIDSAWEELWTGNLFMASGRICGVGNYMGEMRYYPDFDLGQEMTLWHTRVCSKLVDNDRDPGFPRDIYRINLFTLQFWLPRGCSSSR
ncbi:hypothetical protein SAMN05216276_1002312 [Streptosporangium subroseum]|uniref:Uncharacterized protein n=1 Tax=Streptosporangium subroseum TaxID=106412 RepID=A0A239B313_9ACTN|nr:hypothetical protein [Streptosporangium subroseum]SNS01991.1 hypothetical protein SAMN05216276_1002312 [Streptosporangium subroseum]